MSSETTGTATPSKLSADYWRLWTASVISNVGDGVALIAYPWLASAVTRNPVLIAFIAVAQRLPWLLFTLPAGVITDRVDRRKIMVSMDTFRAVVTLLVAVVVFVGEDGLPSPEAVASGEIFGTNPSVYLVLLVASLLFGMAEVLRDNAAQTILPALVEPEHLEHANGNLWGAEMVANSFAGPPLGSVLLGIGFALPFFLDAGTFALAAALVFVISGDFRTRTSTEAQRTQGGLVSWKAEISEGFMWLWRHPLLRPMAIVLGLLNGLGMMILATFVLFAQENLDLETGLFSGVLEPVAEFFGADGVATLIFSVLLMAGAVGGVLGSVFAARISKTLGSGPSLAVTILFGSLTSLVIGFTSQWWVVWLAMMIGVLTAVLWNVITVSLRQTIIPDELLGRVNSVYRFFGWGMMPLGSLAGGVVVWIAEQFVDRGDALRWPYFVVAVAHALLLIYALPRLTTARIEGARAAATGEVAATDE